MQLNNNVFMRKLLGAGFRQMLIQTWRIYTSTPLHKRARLSLFLSGMWILCVLLPTRALVLLACYLWFRHVDDVADKELTNPLGGSLIDFIRAKRNFLIKLEKGDVEESDFQGINSLMLFTHMKCLRWGFDIIPSMLEILDSVTYDVKRSEIEGIPGKKEIEAYFEKLDFPTVLETLRIIGEWAILPSDLKAFMFATRIYYNLRDILRDAEMGIVNIPMEEMEKYGIDPNCIKEINSFDALLSEAPFREWFMDQLNLMREFLKEGKKVLQAKGAMPVTRLILFVAFALPCRKFIKQWERA